MNTQIKIAFYWLLIAVCFLTHTIFHMFGLFYGADIRLPDAPGAVPTGVQVFNTIIFTLTFLLALLALNISGKTFRLISLVWSLLFLILNIVHLAEATFVEEFDVSQICLLTFILAVNSMLITTLWKSIKEKNSQTKVKLNEKAIP
ncbi:MAG: hypothetical protein LBH04_06000 [Tannerellaceae bacterium]|jgi:uncharacterized membrane protein YhaH (DUF805 family)|nr:hypothetical protein [Tannerellaceae bacterium]